MFMRLNAQGGQPPNVPNAQSTDRWLLFPFTYSTGVSSQIVNQPRNLVLNQPELRGVLQVLGAQAFGNVPVANLILPQPAQIRGSTVQGWLMQQLLASQQYLPGRP